MPLLMLLNVIQGVRCKELPVQSLLIDLDALLHESVLLGLEGDELLPKL